MVPIAPTFWASTTGAAEGVTLAQRSVLPRVMALVSPWWQEHWPGRRRRRAAGPKKLEPAWHARLVLRRRVTRRSRPRPGRAGSARSTRAAAAAAYRTDPTWGDR